MPALHFVTTLSLLMLAPEGGAEGLSAPPLVQSEASAPTPPPGPPATPAQDQNGPRDPAPPTETASPAASSSAPEAGFLDFGDEGKLAFVSVQGLGGAIAGGIMGSRLSGGHPGYTLLGGLVGGLTLGLWTASYFVLTPRNVASLSVITSLSMSLAAIGLSVQLGTDPGTAIVGAVLGAQAGLAATFLLTLPTGNVSDEDTALIRMTAINALGLCAVGMWVGATMGAPLPWTGLFYAPALGVATGAGLAVAIDVPQLRSNTLAAVPGAALVIGLTTLFVLERFRGVTAQTALTISGWVVAASYGLGLLGAMVFDLEEPNAEDTPHVSAVPLLQPGYGRTADLVQGAALVGRF